MAWLSAERALDMKEDFEKTCWKVAKRGLPNWTCAKELMKANFAGVEWDPMWWWMRAYDVLVGCD